MADWATFGQDAAIVLTLLLLEAVLSFDNAAVLAAMIRKLPVEDRRKALLYGLGGAYVLRITAIFLAWWLIKTPELKLIGGGYLVFLFAKHMFDLIRHRNVDHNLPSKPGWLMRMGVPMLWATVIQIELIDLAFAIDQVVAAVGFTEKIYLIIIASVVGILFLRLAAVFMARVMDWLPLLEHMAFIAVGFVGLKLVLDFWDIHIHTLLSVAVTLTLFVIPIALKLTFDLPKSAPGEHSAMHSPAASARPPSPPRAPPARSGAPPTHRPPSEPPLRRPPPPGQRPPSPYERPPPKR